MIYFRPDTVLPHDPAGWGHWLLGHFLEHREMLSAARALSPAVNVPDYALQAWKDDPGAVTSWLNQHANVHLILRARANFSGIDLAAVDLSNDGSFLEWIQIHSTEHAALRAFYGIT